MPIPPQVIAGAVKVAPYVLSGIGSLMSGKKRNKQSNPIAEIMNRQFTSKRSIGGFGSSTDSLKGSDRNTTYEFDPRLKSYQDTQLGGLSSMPAFTDLKGGMASLQRGDNPFYNEASNIRSRSYDNLLGTMGSSLFRRGIGNSSIMGTALGRLNRDNSDREFADVTNSLNANQQYNANAQTSAFGGLNNLFNYATVGQADALSNRQQMLGGAGVQMQLTRQQDSPLGDLLSLAGGSAGLGQMFGKMKGLSGAGGGINGGGMRMLGKFLPQVGELPPLRF